VNSESCSNKEPAKMEGHEIEPVKQGNYSLPTTQRTIIYQTNIIYIDLPRIISS
jgi:hypothetical protein